MEFSDGSWYFGEWRAGKRDGKVCVVIRLKQTQTDSQEQFVIFRTALSTWAINQGTHVEKNSGDRYDGFFKAGLKHGKGQLKQRNGPNGSWVRTTGVWEAGQLVKTKESEPAEGDEKSAPSADDSNLEREMSKQQADARRAEAEAKSVTDSVRQQQK
jgi:hypothetical protein